MCNNKHYIYPIKRLNNICRNVRIIQERQCFTYAVSLFFAKGAIFVLTLPPIERKGDCTMSLMEVISLIGLLVTVAGVAYRIGYDNGQNSNKKTKK